MRTELEIRAQIKYFKSLMEKYKNQNVTYNIGFLEALEWVIEESEVQSTDF